MYFIKTHPTPDIISKMVELAALRYEEAHDKPPKSVIVNEIEETISVDGVGFTFWEFIGD